MDASPPGARAHATADRRTNGDHRRVEIALEPRHDLAPVRDRLHEVSAIPGGSRSRDPRSGGRARRRRAGAAPRTRSRCTPSAASGRCGRSPRCRRRGGGGRAASSADHEPHHRRAATTSPSATRAATSRPTVPGIASDRPESERGVGAGSPARARPATAPRTGHDERRQPDAEGHAGDSRARPCPTCMDDGHLLRALGRGGERGNGEERDAEGLHEARPRPARW